MPEGISIRATPFSSSAQDEFPPSLRRAFIAAGRNLDTLVSENVDAARSPFRECLMPFPTLFSRAAAGILRVAVEPPPLADIESAWNRTESGKRIVFTM